MWEMGETRKEGLEEEEGEETVVRIYERRINKIKSRPYLSVV